jgi:probable HAF family extracellular repeat protein
MKRLMIAALCLAATLAQARTNGWTVVDLGALGPAGSVATSINNNGDVTGYSRAAGSSGGELYHAFLYQSGGMMDLGKPAASTFVQVNGMNDAGTLVATDDMGNGHLWKEGRWIPMNFHGKPKAVNRVDMVVGTFPLGAGERAFLWASGSATELGTLGGTKSRGNSINDKGTVVGSATIAGDGTSHAFLYDNGDMKDLGTLGGTYSSANDINNFGVVVGGAYNASNRMTAFVWDLGGMRPLLNAGETSSRRPSTTAAPWWASSTTAHSSSTTASSRASSSSTR